MRIILTQLSGALRSVIRAFFTNDLDVMSDEVREILANREDAKKYMDAISKLKEGKEDSVTITLSNNKELTLIQ